MKFHQLISTDVFEFAGPQVMPTKGPFIRTRNNLRDDTTSFMCLSTGASWIGAGWKDDDVILLWNMAELLKGTE